MDWKERQGAVIEQDITCSNMNEGRDERGREGSKLSWMAREDEGDGSQAQHGEAGGQRSHIWLPFATWSR